MIDLLERTVLSRWRGIGLPGAPPRRLSILLAPAGAGPHGKVVVYVFRPGDPRPLLLAKIPRDGPARQRLLHEHDLLEELTEAAPGLAGKLFPLPLFRVEAGGRLLTGQTVLPGEPMAARFPPLRPAGGRPRPGKSGPERTERGRSQALGSLYGEAKEWLDDFRRGTGLLEGSEAALWEGFLRSAHFHLETFDPPGPERDEVEGLIQEMEARRGRTALCGYGHGDLRPAHLLRKGHRGGAIDWELGEKRVFPWVDPVCFAMHASLRAGVLSGEGRVAGFESGFLRDGWLRELNREFLDECFAGGGAPLDVLPLAVPACILSITHRAARRAGVDDPETRRWRWVARLCLRPGAREALDAGLGVVG